MRRIIIEENENKYGKYLPIGTVVMLRNGKKRVMINGFCPTTNNNGVLVDSAGSTIAATASENAAI